MKEFWGSREGPILGGGCAAPPSPALPSAEPLLQGCVCPWVLVPGGRLTPIVPGFDFELFAVCILEQKLSWGQPGCGRWGIRACCSPWAALPQALRFAA